MNIFSIHAGRTDFLKPHVEYLRYYCKDNFTYYCVDNFVDSKDIETIKNQCLDLGVEYVRPSFNRKGNAFDHGTCLNLLKQYTSDDVINVIYDSNFSNIDFNGFHGCDVGGKTQEYIKSGKTVRWMKHTPGIGSGPDRKIFLESYNPDYGCQVIENSFMHYYKGTNWNRSNPELVKQKTEWFFKLLEKSKSEEIFNQKYLDKYQTIFSHSFRHWNGSQKPFVSNLNPYYEN